MSGNNSVKKAVDLETNPITEVIKRNDTDGSWEGIIKYYDKSTGEMVPRVKVKVRSISNIFGKRLKYNAA